MEEWSSTIRRCIRRGLFLGMVAGLSLSATTAWAGDEEPEDAQQAEEADETTADSDGEESANFEEFFDSGEVLSGPEDVHYVLEGDYLLSIVDGETHSSIRSPCSGPAAVEKEHLLVSCGARGIVAFTLEEPTTPRVVALKSIDEEAADIYLVGDQWWIDYVDGSGEIFDPKDTFAFLDVDDEADDDEVADEDEPEEAVVEAGIVDDDAREDDAPREGLGIAVSEPPEPVGAPEPPATDEGSPVSRALDDGAVRSHINVRPFLPIDVLGVGILADLGLTYYSSGYLAYDVTVDPLGVTLTTHDTQDIQTFAGNARISFVADNFRVGLGAGVSRVEPEAGDPLFESVGLSAVQYLRVGSLDDRHFSVTTNFVTVDRGWEFGGLTFQGQRPADSIRPNMSFLGRVGHGVAGHILVEVGIRQRISGGAGADSVYVIPTVGLGSISQEEIEYTGPMIGLGFEWGP